MLDIPTDKDGNSVYKGPYVTAGNDQAAFNKAVECTDDKTVVFHLNQPVGDFNYTVTLLSFSPVPKSADTGEKYDDKPVSSGPYGSRPTTRAASWCWSATTTVGPGDRRLPPGAPRTGSS